MSCFKSHIRLPNTQRVFFVGSMRTFCSFPLRGTEILYGHIRSLYLIIILCRVRSRPSRGTYDALSVFKLLQLMAIAVSCGDRATGCMYRFNLSQAGDVPLPADIKEMRFDGLKSIKSGKVDD